MRYRHIHLHTIIRRVSIIVVLVLIGGIYVIGQIETPMPDFTDNRHLRTFPSDLLCDLQQVTGEVEGSEWLNIYIGESTLSQLEQTLLDINSDYKSSDDDLQPRFVIFNTETISNTDIPFAVQACLKNDLIMALAVSYTPYHPHYLLSDFIAEFGIPDTVTWTDGLNSRVIFWFEVGFAAKINFPSNEKNVGLTDGRVQMLVYFPYQKIEYYEEHWPYNQVRKFNPYLVSPEDESNGFGIENVFDFDTMLATITAQPSPTLTATFTPYPTSTPTATP